MALDDKADSTRQVSTNNRYISFGLIAVTYALLLSNAPFAVAMTRDHRRLILVVGALGCLGVIFDYLHYIAATKAADGAINNKTPGYEHLYNKKWMSRRLRDAFYWARTGASLLGAVLLVVLIWLSWSAFDPPQQQGRGQQKGGQIADQTKYALEKVGDDIAFDDAESMLRYVFQERAVDLTSQVCEIKSSLIRKAADSAIVVGRHDQRPLRTDAQRRIPTNMALARQRANSVADYLATRNGCGQGFVRSYELLVARCTSARAQYLRSIS